jgi:hypothetical protein
VSSCASTGGQAADEGAGTPSATAVPSASAATQPVTTVVVSDDPAVATAGSTAAGTWPGELAALLAGSGTALDLTVAAAADTGFAVVDPTGSSFADLVRERVVHSTQLVVFSETRFGSVSGPDVGEGAREAFAAVEETAPDALVVVIAPWTSAPDLPASTAEVRAAVREAADSAEVAVTYVDPVADGWPTGAGQQAVAELLYPDVAPVVTALARSGALD